MAGLGVILSSFGDNFGVVGANGLRRRPGSIDGWLIVVEVGQLLLRLPLLWGAIGVVTLR